MTGEIIEPPGLIIYSALSSKKPGAYKDKQIYLNVRWVLRPGRAEGLRVGLGSDISGGHDLNMFRMLVYAIQVSKMHYQLDHSKAFLTLPEVFWIATKSAGSFFGKVGSFEPGYDFDALVIDDDILHPEEYSLLHRLERYIYLGDDRQILHRFCRGQEVPEPAM